MRPAYSKLFKILLIVPILMTLGLVDGAAAKSRNPCSTNPCAAKNPCMAKNPCAAKNIPIRKNPIKDSATLKKMGERLWGDTALGTSGLACGTCHMNGAGLKKWPFPKYVKMTGDFVTMDQMINFCMVNPMKGKPLAWYSREMTALGAYITAHSGADAAPMNPCAAKNPCGSKNPCAMKNPCGARNPCGMK